MVGWRWRDCGEPSRAEPSPYYYTILLYYYYYSTILPDVVDHAGPLAPAREARPAGAELGAGVALALRPAGAVHGA